MDASTPTIVSGAGDVSSRQSHAPGLRGDVIHTQQLEHPSTRSTSSKILAVIFAIYHVIYSVAWLIEFIVLIDYVDNIRWIPVMATGGISFLFIGILEHFTRTKKHSTNIAMLMFTIVGLVAVNITFLWSEFTIISFAGYIDMEENIFPWAVATVLLFTWRNHRSSLECREMCDSFR
ncbi:hypothetical protein NP493_1228g00020 [Ridgeia piscesae]|uniref:Uncharacterized protein n=1 Tax=Ridgeia piscesae TaxID=27915 RepID=A0AAD9KB70_RIDPI|nr:hypothetical protein NP493_1228g00020 [Ridgeia piscesae]